MMKISAKCQEMIIFTFEDPSLKNSAQADQNST